MNHIQTLNYKNGRKSLKIIWKTISNILLRTMILPERNFLSQMIKFLLSILMHSHPIHLPRNQNLVLLMKMSQSILKNGFVLHKSSRLTCRNRLRSTATQKNHQTAKMDLQDHLTWLPQMLTRMPSLRFLLKRILNLTLID